MSWQNWRSNNINENASRDVAIIYTGGSVHCGEKSGWEFSARVREKLCYEE